ncbi:hypothetical protein AB4097_01385 [Microvirga sp. 2MCAF35]|uniref:hypothetical protein n=1 Tax=Microvirga sp. 2MCAF35 TaxID=3232987 RepID=UPI003F965FAC
MSKIKVKAFYIPSSIDPTARFFKIMGWLVVFAAIVFLDVQLKLKTGIGPLLSFFGFGLFLYKAFTISTDGKTLERAAIKSALEDAAFGPVERVSIVSCKSAIGIGEGFLLILEKGKIAAIPFDAIRDCWWELPGYEQHTVYGTGAGAIAASFQANAANSVARAHAYKNSGFFFKVQSIDYPLWQFHTTDQRLLRQWEEIIQQAFERHASSSAKDTAA